MDSNAYVKSIALIGRELQAKEGDTLPDGTTLDEITDTGGVAVNLFGDVVFHGRTAGVDSVFVGSQGDTAP